jgi:hypothetical protein
LGTFKKIGASLVWVENLPIINKIKHPKEKNVQDARTQVLTNEESF